MMPIVYAIGIRLFLIPADLALLLIGPRYKLYLWLFGVAPPGWLAWLGRLRAIRAANYAARRVPAYQSFLTDRNIRPGNVVDLDLPETSKENYVKVYAPDQRCVNGVLPSRHTAIDESSGSTGTPFNWLRSDRERHSSHVFISHFARYAFGSGPWITINGFSMGAWATGSNMGMALQRNSMVKNTGPDLQKIFSTLEHFGPGHRYLICGYPPFLKHLIDVARDRKFPLHDYRLMAMLGGEGNSEGLRDYLYQEFKPVFSGYGATDIEIGVAGETPLSLAVRRACRDNQALRQALFGSDSRLPMVFQFNPLMHHIETNGEGELIFTITRRNILTPRIRYNIRDEGGTATFKELKARCRSVGVDLLGLETGSGAHPLRMPFMWVFGRRDSTVSVMGANIYPEDIEECIYAEPELAKLTNSFALGLKELSAGNVRPLFSFEIRGDIGPGLAQRFEESMVRRMRAINSDFREAYSEYPDAVTPVVELHPLGTGPFAQDAFKIKQARVLKAEMAEKDPDVSPGGMPG